MKRLLNAGCAVWLTSIHARANHFHYLASIIRYSGREAYRVHEQPQPEQAGSRFHHFAT
jgi:hypothetical protein